MPFYELDFDIEKNFTKDFSNEFYKDFSKEFYKGI